MSSIEFDTPIMDVKDANALPQKVRLAVSIRRPSQVGRDIGCLRE